MILSTRSKECNHWRTADKSIGHSHEVFRCISKTAVKRFLHLFDFLLFIKVLAKAFCFQFSNARNVARQHERKNQYICTSAVTASMGDGAIRWAYVTCMEMRQIGRYWNWAATKNGVEFQISATNQNSSNSNNNVL